MPPDAAETIFKLAAEAYTLSGIASRLQTNRKTLRRWMDEDPSLQDAHEAGLGELESAMSRVLYRAAMKGNWVPALAMGKTRFGWIEGREADSGNRVNVVFNLPGAMTPAQFVVEGSNDSRSALDQPVPTTRLGRS